MNREIAPEIHPINSVKLVFPDRIELENGIDLFWIKDVQDNTVKLDIIWDAGSKYQSGPLISKYCNELLFSGNETNNAKKISEEIDYLGGYLSHEHNYDHGGFTLFGLNHQINDLFSIISKAFDSVDFLEEEINKMGDIKQKQFELSLEKVNVNARRHFVQNLFGSNHPYGSLAEYDHFKAITQNDLKAFHKNQYLQAKPVIFLVGNVEDSFITQLKEWSNQFTSENHPLPLPPIQQKKRSVLH